jgi:hypothetical protein
MKSFQEHKTKTRRQQTERRSQKITPAEYLLLFWPNCATARQAISARRELKQGPRIFLSMYSGICLSFRKMEQCEGEREILVRLMRATTTHTVLKLINQSRWLRGVVLRGPRVRMFRKTSVGPAGPQRRRHRKADQRHRDLLGSFLWTHPAWFLEIKANRRFPKYVGHLEKQVEFVTQSVAAVMAGYQPSTGIRRLSEDIPRCYKLVWISERCCE